MGETLHLPPELEAEAMTAQEEHRQMHPWEGLIEGFLAEDIPADWSSWDLQKRQMWRAGGLKYDGPLVPRTRVCAQEIWCELLERRKGDMTQRDTREINQILERMPGWAPNGVRLIGGPYGKQRCFGRATNYEMSGNRLTATEQQI